MSAPRIAICVVTYNSAALIKDLAASVPEGASGTDWTLVIADNASEDDTLAQVAQHAPDALVVRTGANLGYAAGINAATRAVGPRDSYLILNPDVRLGRGCVATLYAALGHGVGIAVPRLLDARGELIWSMRREPTVLRAWADALIGAERAGRHPMLGEVVTDPSQYTSARPTDWAEGSTMMVSAACWDACGKWDESFFLYSEETDFALRAGDAGYAVWYEPAAVAIHLEGGSASSPRHWSLLVANRVSLFSRRRGPLSTASFWLALVAREGSRALLGKKTSLAAVPDLVSRRRMVQRRGPDWLNQVKV